MTDATSRARDLLYKYVVWSNVHGLWWRANRCGYTADPLRAGLYEREEADAIQGSRSSSEVYVRPAQSLLSASPGTVGEAIMASIIDTRTHAAIPRKPSEADVERVSRAIESTYDLLIGGDIRNLDQVARAAIAALVQEQTQGGEREEV